MNDTVSTQDRQKDRRILMLLLLIMVAALITDMFFYNGFFASDDIQYLRGAFQLAEEGSMKSITMGTIRMGMVIPAALMAFLFKSSIFAVTMVFVISHLLIIPATFWLGKLVHQHRTGLLAALFIAFCPLSAGFSTMILPDIPSTMLLVISMCFLFQAYHPGSSGVFSKFPALAISGLVFSLSMTVKQTTIIVLPFVGIFLIMNGLKKEDDLKTNVLKIVKDGFAFISGFLFGSILYFIVFKLATGLWTPFGSQDIVKRLSGFSDRVAAKPYSSTVERFWRLISFTKDADLGLLRWLLIPTLVIYPMRKKRSWYLYALFLFLCFYMTWGTFSLSGYSPPPMQIRYFVLALPFLCIMISHTCLLPIEYMFSVKRPNGAAHWMPVAAKALLVVFIFDYMIVSWGRLNLTAGKHYYTQEVTSTRHAIDYIRTNSDLPIAMSSWLSERIGRIAMPNSMSRLVLTNSSTGLLEITHKVDQNRFYYLVSQVEERYKETNPAIYSELDMMMQGLETDSKTDIYEAKLMARYSIFRSRLGGLMYLYAGAGDHPLMQRQAKRFVYVYLMSPADPRLDELDAKVLDLSTVDVAPTWVHRVDEYDVRYVPDDTLRCKIVGNSDNSRGHYGGLRLRTGSFRAMRFDVRIINPENISAIIVDATAGPGRNNRIRWVSTERFLKEISSDFKTVTFAVGQPVPGFSYNGENLDAPEVNHVHIFIKLKTVDLEAGFEIARFRIWD